MLSHAIRQLLGFPRRAAARGATAGHAGVFLLGDETYTHDVTEVTQQQSGLYAFLAEALEGEAERHCIAVLDFERDQSGPAGRVAITIEGQAVGLCPPHLGNQCREWLREWNYSEDNVLCRALIMHRHGLRSTHADRFIVKLDIVVPFKMTTF